MEKCSGLTSLWLTGEAEAREGVVLSIGMEVASLMILKKIGSPFLNYNFLEGNFLDRTWVRVAASLGGVRALHDLELFPNAGDLNDKTLENHFSELLSQISRHCIYLGFQVGVGYIFPRVTSFFIIVRCGANASFLGIQTIKKIFCSS